MSNHAAQTALDTDDHERPNVPSNMQGPSNVSPAESVIEVPVTEPVESQPSVELANLQETLYVFQLLKLNCSLNFYFFFRAVSGVAPITPSTSDSSSSNSNAEVEVTNYEKENTSPTFSEPPAGTGDVNALGGGIDGTSAPRSQHTTLQNDTALDAELPLAPPAKAVRKGRSVAVKPPGRASTRSQVPPNDASTSNSPLKGRGRRMQKPS